MLTGSQRYAIDRVKEFTLDDFSHENLRIRSIQKLKDVIDELNYWRDIYQNGGMDDNFDGTSRVYKPGDEEVWQQMIQLLPSCYNQNNDHTTNETY